MIKTKSNIKIYLSAILILVVFSIFANVQEKNEDTVKLDTLLVKMSQAVDPDNKLSELKTRIAEAELYMPLQNIKAQIITKYKAPDKFYIKTVLGDGQFVVQAYNGTVGWKSENGEKPVGLTGKELDSFRFSSGLESSQHRWKELFKKMILDKNKFEIDKYQCYKLIGYPKDNYNIKTPVSFYVDDQKYLIRKIELTVYSVAGDIKQTVFVETYENIDSVQIPAKTKTDIFGAELFLTVIKCNFNKDIEDSVFNFN